MIDTVIYISGGIELCRTFTYNEILSFDIGKSKEIKTIEHYPLSNKHKVIFADDTDFVFTSEKLIGYIKVDGDLLKVYVGDKVLKQVETDIVYGSSVIDLIAGYKDGKPYSRFSYVEVDKPEINTIKNEE